MKNKLKEVALQKIIEPEKKVEEKIISKEQEISPRREFNLVVKSPFREYKKGDHISDQTEIEKILDCHEHTMVIKSAHHLLGK